MSTVIDYKTLYEQSQAQQASLQLQVLQLSQQLAQLQKMIFGSRQERFVPQDPASPQLSLAIQTEAMATATITATKEISYTRHQVAVE